MLDNFSVSLLSVLGDNVLIGAHNHDCRPIVQFEGVPNVELAVVEAGVLHIVANDGLPEDVQGFFLVKLGTMDANECNFREVFELIFEFLQLSEHMDAVDAAARPEVDDDEFALQVVIEAQRLLTLRVEPP